MKFIKIEIKTYNKNQYRFRGSVFVNDFLRKWIMKIRMPTALKILTSVGLMVDGVTKDTF